MSNKGSRPCPLLCGSCCDELWRDVVKADESLLECPHYTDTGCKLPREARHPGCNSYLCEIATAFVAETIDRKRAEQLMEQAQHFVPPEWWPEVTRRSA